MHVTYTCHGVCVCVCVRHARAYLPKSSSCYYITFSQARKNSFFRDHISVFEMKIMSKLSYVYNTFSSSKWVDNFFTLYHMFIIYESEFVWTQFCPLQIPLLLYWPFVNRIPFTDVVGEALFPNTFLRYLFTTLCEPLKSIVGCQLIMRVSFTER